MHHHTVLAIPGSLRRSSINGWLVDATSRLAPAGMAIELYTGLRALPHYDADIDNETPPAAVAELRERIDHADGLLIATPEYNGSIPGVLKNALDWASTPHRASALTSKPVAVLGATPGRSATAAAQAHLRQILARSGCEVLAEPEVTVSKAYELFDEGGRLADETLAASLAELLRALRLTICPPELAAAV